MPSSSRPATVERATPLLGTLVSVRAALAGSALANAAIDAAFDAARAVHRLMSFHDPDSDLSRLHRALPGEAVTVDPHTAAVLAFALELARRTGGAFDPTIAGKAVGRGDLPRPEGSRDPDRGVCWRDIRLEGLAVRRLRSVWIDLGGVAKGYAVDLAVAALKQHGIAEGCVNAGGDLRVFGARSELIELRAGDPAHTPVLELTDGAAASSGGGRGEASHFDGRGGGAIDPRRFVCVTAPSCMAADALTKVVLALGDDARPTLAAFQAEAHEFDAARGWRSWEMAA